jgi:hypothetical protein
VGKAEGERSLARQRREWVDNSKVDLGERGWCGMERFDIAQNRNQWKALVNTVMTNLLILPSTQ